MIDIISLHPQELGATTVRQACWGISMILNPEGLAQVPSYLSLNQRFGFVYVLTHPQNRRGQHAPVLNPSQKRGGSAHVHS